MVKNKCESEHAVDKHADSFVELIRAARAGDDIAAGQLLQQCRPYLLAIANQELSPAVAAKVGASDIVQNTMMSAQRCLDGFQGEDRRQLQVWLRTILQNDLQQARRQFAAGKRRVDRECRMGDDERQGPREDGIAGPVGTPSAVAVSKEEQHQLRDAMAKLSPHEQKVIEMRNWQRLPFAEIGSHLGKSSEATRKIWSRAIVKLQRELGVESE